MITLTIKPTLDESQVKGLYQLYLYQLDERKPLRSDFIKYMKMQLMNCGNSEFLLPTGGMEDYPDLTPTQETQLWKWKLL